MHEQVLPHLEVPDLVPAKDAAHRQLAAVVDGVSGVVLNVLVDVVGEHEVNLLVGGNELPQLGEKGLQGVRVGPVVGVDVLEVDTVGVCHRLHDGDAVAAVLLVDGLHDVGIALLPLVGLGRGLVLGAAVIDDDDLHVIGIVGAHEDGLDALIHVGG